MHFAWCAGGGGGGGGDEGERGVGLLSAIWDRVEFVICSK